MTSIGVHSSSRKATPITIAGRRMKRWIVQSLVSAPRKARKFAKHRQTIADATIPTSPLATVLLGPEPKHALKTTESGKVVHDVFLPSETARKTLHRVSTDGAVLSGSSGSSSSNRESVSTPSSSHEGYQEPPSLPKRHCNECRSELGENETCSCVPGINVVPPSRLPSPQRSLSTLPPSSSGEEVSSVHTSNVDQIPDEEGVQVEITEVKQEVEPECTGVVPSRSLWEQFQEEGSQWGVPETIVTWSVTNEVDTRAEEPLEPQESFGTTTATTPPPAETEEASTFLLSSDERMNLTVRNFLGAGSHGTVVSADWAEGCRQVAVKVSHKLFISELDCTEPGLKSLKNELDVLKALKHSREDGELGSNFFPELFKSWQDAKNVYFAMDLYAWNLEDLRWADPNWDATTGDKLLWAAEMVLGVQALHRMRILHRDIKPANVFITSAKHIIIGDYGLARAWLDPFYANFPSSSLKARDAPGTMAYLAPEVVMGFYQDQVNVEVRKYANYGFEADIWSLGVTICDTWCQSGGLFRLQEGEDHLDHRSAIPSKILQMEVRPAVEKIVDGHPIWHLITRMLDRNPRTRIGYDEILAHPVFAHLDWNRVANLEYTPTWSFPEAEPLKRPKLVRDKLEFTHFYRPPEDIRVDDADSERTRADKLDRRHGQVLRRAMGAARDWVGDQQAWIKDEVLGEYDFDWTAPEVIAEDEKWALDDD